MARMFGGSAAKGHRFSPLAADDPPERWLLGGACRLLQTVAVDVGASNGRVYRGGYDGHRVHLEEIHRFINKPVSVQGRLYWDFLGIYREIQEGIAKAAELRQGPASIGIDTWAVDFGLLDRKGYLLDSPRHYRDRRTQNMIESVTRLIGKRNLFDRTGIQFLPLNTIYQLAAMQRENPELLACADKLLLIPDLINYFLTGTKQTEFTNATTTQLFHPGIGGWDWELIHLLGLPDRLFPEIVRPGTELGACKDPELVETGKFAHTRVVHVASHDTASAVVSVPVEPGLPSAFISSGTWSLMGVTVSSPVINDLTFRFNFTNEGGFGHYRLLKNVMGLWLLQETQRAQGRGARSTSVAELLMMAERSRPFPFLFNPDDPRLFHPGDIPRTVRRLCEETGQPGPETVGDLVRGILENLAFRYRYVLDQLEQVLSTRLDVIHVVGGGSQNDLLCQFTANATNRPVIAGPVEASALGNILVQLYALGELQSLEDMRDVVRRSMQIRMFEPADTDAWEEQYRKFIQLIDGDTGEKGVD